MPSEIYELIAQAARYWFLLLMLIIAWRSWRWYRKDRRQAKKRLKLLPDAGFIGEMVVITGAGNLKTGDTLMVPREGTLGSARSNDLCVQAPGVSGKHLWFRFDDKRGLMIEPFGKNPVNVDDVDFTSRREPLYMGHGSWLYVGECEMRLRLFAGFESVGHAQRRSGVEVQEQPQQQMDPAQMYAMQQWMMQQQWLAQQQAYQQGYQQAMAQMEEEYEEYEEEPQYAEDELPYDMAQIAQEEGMVDHSLFMRPADQRKPELPVYDEPAPVSEPQPVFYAPVADEEPEPEWADDEPWSPYDEDMTDAAAPPKSAYVGHDEAEVVKREVWDKYFGGGQKR